MVTLLSILLSIFLIFIIFLRIPQESAGLSNISTKTNLINSPVSTDRFLNTLISIGVTLYFVVAIILNLANQ